MREHAYLPAMVGFMRNHVAEHFRANRPRLRPAVPSKLRDAGPATVGDHLSAASSALGQSRKSLLRRAVRAVKLCWNLQVRSCKPDPFGSDIVHVGEDRRDGAGVAGRFCRRFRWQFRCPGSRIKVFDKKLVHAVIGGKDLDCGSAELRLNLVSTGGHGFLLLALWSSTDHTSEQIVGIADVLRFLKRHPGGRAFAIKV